ncbi:transporter substrate-binding domain-containing protein [Ensifer sp. BR816]|uniref:transporter substrate-binding domain-containing protein n=1 Tax=Rhizobium sp. (strain BR816) TaxID=1057002 RepID=UPI0003728222|nr:transporter substrate-binding domain-containing protein [Ensifer sp. BR816]
MFILPDRCRNVLFAQPLAKAPDALIVRKGNPDNIHSYQDIRDKGLTMATGAGYISVKWAKEVGIPDDKVLQVATAVEIALAVKVGRAAAGTIDYFGFKGLVEKDNSVETASPYTPWGKPGYPSVAFASNEQATVDAFNAALKDYMGSDEMLKAVSQYGYTKGHLPGNVTTDELCKG